MEEDCAENCEVWQISPHFHPSSLRFLFISPLEQRISPMTDCPLPCDQMQKTNRSPKIGRQTNPIEKLASRVDAQIGLHTEGSLTHCKNTVKKINKENIFSGPYDNKENLLSGGHQKW